MEHPYSSFDSKDLILRDLLAIDRTKLANERTLLSYLRTSFAFAAGAITLIKLFDSSTIHLISYIGLTASIVGAFVGLYRFFHTEHMLSQIQEASGTEPKHSRILHLKFLFSRK